MSRLHALFLGFLLGCVSVATFSQEPAKPVDVPEPPAPHFLTDAELQRMQEFRPDGGEPMRRWTSDKLTATRYGRLIVDPVIYDPVAEPGDQVDQRTLDAIAAHLTGQLREKLGSKLKLVDAPGAGTLRLSTAITGVVVKTEGLKPYEVLPVAAVFGLAKGATGTRKQDVRLYVETRIVDAANGELLGVTQREVKGRDLKGKKDRLELDDVAPAFDEALRGALETLSQRGF